MTLELLVNVTPQETRVAVVENGVLQEVFIERARRRGLVGNIYKGVVRRVLPGMQAAFVDIGLERAAFLHASDIAVSVDNEKIEHSGGEDNITRLLREGQQVLVQVIKDPLGTKGARLTTQATMLARQKIEELKTLSSSDLDTADGNDTVGIYSRNWVTDPVPGSSIAYKLIVTVQWTRRGPQRSVVLQSITRGNGT